MSVSVFIDTNLLVYAHVADDAKKHAMTATLLKTCLIGDKIIVSVQVLSEFYSAMLKYNRSHDEIASFILGIAQYMNVASLKRATVERCLTLKKRYGYSYWDSLILAAAIENHCSVLYSEDMQHGQIIEGTLTIQNPFVAR
jgi:predicted nucleic acid-binding protein